MILKDGGGEKGEEERGREVGKGGKCGGGGGGDAKTDEHWRMKSSDSH